MTPNLEWDVNGLFADSTRVVVRPPGDASVRDPNILSAAKAYVDANLKYGSTTVPPIGTAQDPGCLSIINEYIDRNWAFDASTVASCNTCTPQYKWTSGGLYIGDTRIVPASIGAQVAKDRVAADMLCGGKHVTLPSTSTSTSASTSASTSLGPPPTNVATGIYKNGANIITIYDTTSGEIKIGSASPVSFTITYRPTTDPGIAFLRYTDGTITNYTFTSRTLTTQSGTVYTFDGPIVQIPVAGRSFTYQERDQFDTVALSITYTFGTDGTGTYSSYNYGDSTSQDYGFAYRIRGNIVTWTGNGGTGGLTFNPVTYCLTNGPQDFCP